MRTSLTLDDGLMADAAVYSGTTNRSRIVNLALDHHIKWMAGRRQAALGGACRIW
jgi:Arc/MetJ family transcription regulator